MGKKKRKNAINDGDHESLFPVSGHQQQQQQQQQPKKRQKYDNSNNNNGNQHQQKKKKKNRKNNNKNKKRYPHRREKYWIEDCQVTVDRHAIATAALTVLITRSELTDNHTFKKKDEAVPAATGDTTIPEADDTVDEPEAGCSKIDVQANESTKFEHNESAPDLENDSATRVHDQAFKCATAIVAECDTDSKKGAVEETGTKEAESTNTTAPTTADVDNTNPSAKEISGLSSDIDTSNDTEHTAKRKTEICVQRDPSANAAPKKFSRQNFRPLPDGDCGDGIKNPYPKHVVADKYWAQRHRLFSRYDQGIQLDKESWYSVTPEEIANHIAIKMTQSIAANGDDVSAREATGSDNLVIMDAFCGAGGNAIAFARQSNVSLVICVDLDKEKLHLAAQNAKIYDIPNNKLLFIHADAFDVLGRYQSGSFVSADQDVAGADEGQENKEGSESIADMHGYRLGGINMLPKTLHKIFLSPPWGGVEYETIGPRKFDLKFIRFDDDLDGEKMLQQASNAVARDNLNVVCFLPRNTNGYEVAKSARKAGISGTMEVEQNVLNDKFKAITIYFRSSKGSDN